MLKVCEFHSRSFRFHRTVENSVGKVEKTVEE